MDLPRNDQTQDLSPPRQRGNEPRRIKYSNGTVYDRESKCFVHSANHIEVGISGDEQTAPPQQSTKSGRTSRSVVSNSPRRPIGSGPPLHRSPSWPPLTDIPSTSVMSRNSMSSIETAQLDEPHPSITIDNALELTMDYPKKKASAKNISARNFRVVSKRQLTQPKPRLYAFGSCLLLVFIFTVVMGATYFIVGPPGNRGSSVAMLVDGDIAETNSPDHLLSNNQDNGINAVNTSRYYEVAESTPLASEVVTNFIHKACGKADLSLPQHRSSCEKACNVARCCYEVGMDDCSYESWCEPYFECKNLLDYPDDNSDTVLIDFTSYQDGVLLTGQIEFLCGNYESMKECREICQPSECCFNSYIPCSKELDGCDPYVFCDVLLDDTDFASGKIGSENNF